jgi:hypothetical protein
MKYTKLQSAMEYLMTYGWAILIIAVVLGVLFQLGVFSSSSYAVRAPPGACQVFKPNGPGTSTNLNLLGVCSGQLPQYVAQFTLTGNSNVLIPSLNTFNPSSFTISAWFMFSSTPASWFALVDKGEFSSVGGFTVGTTAGTTRITAGLYDGAKHELVFPNSGTQMALNTWYHVIFTYGGGMMNGYINGQFSPGGGPSPGAMTLNTLVPVSLGALAAYVPGTFPGSLTNVQIYNASLSANDVADLYGKGMGGAPIMLQNLVGWWPLNGNAKDYSGNNKNGVQSSVNYVSQYGK